MTELVGGRVGLSFTSEGTSKSSLEILTHSLTMNKELDRIITDEGRRMTTIQILNSSFPFIPI